MIRESMALAFGGPLKDTSTYNKQLSLRFLGHDAAIRSASPASCSAARPRSRTPAR